MQKQSGTKIFLIVAAAVAAFLCLCLVLGVGIFVFTRAAKTALPRVQEVPAFEEVIETVVVEAPTTVPEPTLPPVEILVPTETLEPAEIPEPTEEPAPVDTETPVEEPASGPYDEQILGKLIACQSGLTIVSEQIVSLGEDPTLFSDAEWQGSMTLGLAFMQSSCTTFSEITPVPEAYQEAHGYLILAEEEFQSAITNITEGMAESDISRIQAAAQALLNAGEYLQTASELFPEE